MHQFLILLVLIATSTSQKLDFRHSKVFRVIPKNDEQLLLLRSLSDNDEGFSFWSEPSFENMPTDVMVPPSKVKEFTQLLNDTDTLYETYIDDVQRLIDSENPSKLRESEEFGWTSYHTLEEIYNWFDSLENKYPNNVQVLTAGWTSEGRKIKGVKLSYGDNKPRVFFEGGIHAREWISPATVTYLLNQFLTSNDQQVRQLAESYEWYFFPSVNPDGYVYTHTRNRLWRKTRSRNGFCHGADANRNWGYKWMSGGSSRNPCAETFAGSRAFSEVETKTLSNFLETISSNLYAYIGFHSYSQLLLQPYGHTTAHLDNYDQLHKVGLKTIKALSKRYGTEYKTGSIGEAIYIASGSSMDWVRGVLRVPITFTYELRDKGRYGFILPADQIIPNGEEVLDSIIEMFKAAKNYL